MSAGRRLEKAAYDSLEDGTGVEEYTLRSATGMSVRIITYGAIITRIDVPDRAGNLENVVLGYSDLHGYLAQKNTYFGAVIGRYANRIAKGRFTLAGRAYSLAVNNGPHALHGGSEGFDRAVWQARAAPPGGGRAVLELTHVSRAGDEGYPGTLAVTVTYSLGDDAALGIAYRATTDRDTVLNLTNHTYFNLAGEAAGNVEQQELRIDADAYTPVDATLIPTGELAAVAGTPFDFRMPQAIGSRLREAHPQLLFARGYDHNWVLNGRSDGALHRAVRGYDPASVRIVDVSTSEPGVQVYTGNFLDGTEVGSGGKIYRQSAGWTAETQHFPDSPNQPHFPSTLLRAGQTYQSETVFRFAAGVAR